MVVTILPARQFRSLPLKVAPESVAITDFAFVAIASRATWAAAARQIHHDGKDSDKKRAIVKYLMLSSRDGGHGNYARACRSELFAAASILQ